MQYTLEIPAATFRKVENKRTKTEKYQERMENDHNHTTHTAPRPVQAQQLLPPPLPPPHE